MKYTGHVIFNFLILSIFLIIHQDIHILNTQQLLLFVIGFSVGTIYLTPDLDINSEASNKSGLLFLPIRKLTTHRGIIHKWFIGSSIIILYVLFIITILIYAIFGVDGINEFMLQVIKYNKEIIILIIGVVTANILHVFLDKIT